MDISSDLTEFGRTPVAVVSAGAKSILDIPRTLEYLVIYNHYYLSQIYISQFISEKISLYLTVNAFPPGITISGNTRGLCCCIWY